MALKHYGFCTEKRPFPYATNNDFFMNVNALSLLVPRLWPHFEWFIFLLLHMLLPICLFDTDISLQVIGFIRFHMLYVHDFYSRTTRKMQSSPNA
jgi:hypothetical protein